MKSYLSRPILAILAGLILVIWPETVREFIFYALGGIILLTGVLSILANRENREHPEPHPLLRSTNGITNIVFGLILMLFPSFFTGIVMFLFGAILLLFGIGSLINYFKSRKITKTPWGFAIIPALTTACGIGLFFFPNDSGNALFILFGIILLIYGISELIGINVFRRYKKMTDTPTENNIEDVPFQEL